jgi:8-oxo-dGTP pyrophosphatase MutT (NUDIX family)
MNKLTEEELTKIIKPAAAGVLTMTKDGKFLLTKRTSKAHYLGGHWSVPSGEANVNQLESMESCARREFYEETTHTIPDGHKLYLIDKWFTDARMYYLFLYKVPKRFSVKIDWEHEDVNWFGVENLPEPIAPQILDAIRKVAYL